MAHVEDPALRAGSSGSDAHGLADGGLEATTRIFEAGRVFERHRKSTGFSQEAFLQVLFDLHADHRAAFKNRGNADFIAGRLFESFGSQTTQRGAEVVTPQQFRRMLERVGGGDIDPFDAGRTYERFAGASSGSALSPPAFVRLCRSSRLGEMILGCLRADDTALDRPDQPSDPAAGPYAGQASRGRGEGPPFDRVDAWHQRRDSENASGLEGHFAEDPDTRQQNHGPRQHQQARSRRRQGPASPPWQRRDQGSDAGSDADLMDCEDEGALLRRVNKALGKMTETDQQIAALETELHAEARLRHELPEAYSEAKERMLQKYIQNLREKRAKYIDSVKRLRRHARPAPQTDLSKALEEHHRRRRLMPSSYPDFPLAPYELDH